MSDVTRCPNCGRKVPADEECPDCEPDPRPRRQAGPRRSSGKKRRKRSQGPPPLLLWGLVGGGVFLLVGAVAAFFLTRGPAPAGGGGGANNAKDGGGGLLGGLVNSGPSLVVIDSPVPPLPPPSTKLGWDETPLPTDPPAAKAEPPFPWSARVDPPANPPAAVTDQVHMLNSANPVMAALAGPFVVHLPDRWDPIIGGRAKSGKPSPVVDLRTGKPAGGFDFHAPVSDSGRLSPDGQYLVGPDTAEGTPATTKEGVLLVWKRDADKPVARIPLSGVVLWAGFVAADRLAVVTFDSKVELIEGRFTAHSDSKLRLSLWDVATGRLTDEMPLAEGDVAVRLVMTPPVLYPLKDGRKVLTMNPEEDELLRAATAKDVPTPKLFYSARPQLGAVSHGGKYLALGGKTGVTVVSLAEKKVVGRLPVAPLRSRADYHGFGFSEDGATLYALVNVRHRLEDAVYNTHDVQRMFAWSMAEGQPLIHSPNGAQMSPASILRGPLPNSLVVGTYVLHAGSGQLLTEVNFNLARWFGPKKAYHWGPLHGAPADVVEEFNKQNGVKADINRLAAWVRDNDEGRVRKLGGDALAAIVERPPLTPAVRAGVVGVKPAPPAEWAVPLIAPAAPVTADALPVWPDAWADNIAACIEYTYIEGAPYRASRYTGPSRHKMDWRRIDLKTGQDVGPPLPLWPWATRRGGGVIWTQPTVAALSPAGDRLAVVDPNEAARIDVWDGAGQRLFGFQPYGPQGQVAWVGWAGGRLLTLAEGKLTGWEVPACKALFEVDGGYSAPLHMPPGRPWVVGVTPGHADVIDAATGKVLGRCASDRATTVWRYTALSPDGKTLLRGRILSRAIGGANRGCVHLWDLTTGKETGPIAFGPGSAGGGIAGDSQGPGGPNDPWGALWAGGRRILGVGPACSMIDLDAGATTCLYKFTGVGWPPALAELGKRRVNEQMLNDPAGGVWVNVPPKQFDPKKPGILPAWRRLTVPDPTGTGDGPLAAAEGSFPFRSGSSLRVEVDLGAGERSRKLAERIAGRLQLEGYTIAPGGWTLRVTYTDADTKWELTGTGPAGKTVVPMAEVRWDLLAPDGKEVWRGTTNHGWPGGTRSKYYIGTRDAPEHGFKASVTNYFFQGKEPRAAMLAEILDSDAVSQPADLPPALPRAVLQSGGAYHSLPLNAELRLVSK